MAATNGEAPKITLYTSHLCPWAHRVHIVIKELGLPYEESIIDLSRPRDPWYLEINPRGLVPSIKYTGGSLNDEIITESAVVAQFLVDAHPSHLVPDIGNPKGALVRARIQFFVDTWISKANSLWFQIALKDAESEKEDLVKQLVGVVSKEIEPLLSDAKPFFGGSSKITLAEALVAPFIIRVYSSASNDILPRSLLEGFNTLPNFSKWAAEVIKHDSVTYIWDEEKIVAGTRKRIANAKAQSK